MMDSERDSEGKGIGGRRGLDEEDGEECGDGERPRRISRTLV